MVTGEATTYPNVVMTLLCHCTDENEREIKKQTNQMGYKSDEEKKAPQ